jgi:capsular exopolysaccharide synthesis family protein
MAEMYRSICTAILFSKADKAPQTILVTSSQACEGKTVTAINISMMLAQSRGPVLLIDADLHGGQCHEMLGVANGTGLANVLSGNGHASEFVKPTSVRNLSLLGRGTLPPNPADLLGSETMRHMLQSLAGDYRFIVIDSAPLVPVTDSLLLATQVDGVVLVTRGEEVSRNVVRKARERLDYVDAKILGVVLNGVDVSSAEYKDYRSVYRSHYTRYDEPSAGEPSEVILASAPPAETLGAETVAPELFERMAVIVAELASALDSNIVQQKIAALGETLQAFPKLRLHEVIDAVRQEIPIRAARVSFTQRMAKELANLDLSEDIALPPADHSHG